MYYVLKNKSKYEEHYDIMGVFNSLEDMEKEKLEYENRVYCEGCSWQYETFPKINKIY